MTKRTDDPSRDEIASMTKDELLEYFQDNARYDPRSKTAEYCIRFSGRSFFSGDTMELSKKFYAAVKQYRGATRNNVKGTPTF